MKALAEIGVSRAARFGFFTLAMVPYRLALFPQLRVPWLRLFGARIGRGSIFHDVRFFNLYRRGLAGLKSAKSASSGTSVCSTSRRGSRSRDRSRSRSECSS